MSLTEKNKIYKYFKSKKILEVGCNQGSTTQQISQICKKVVAIDNNLEILKLAKKVNPLKNCNYAKVDFFNANKMKALGKFDVIYLREIFNFIDEKEKVKIVTIIKKNLKPSGHIIITDFYSRVFLRKSIISIVLYLFYFQKFDLRSYFKKSKQFHFNADFQIKIFFQKLGFKCSTYNFDLFNKHVPPYLRLVESIYPCKYTTVLRKN
jgi:2-polyprenyl-3-methyl-5-hydroxy-6-metoxy-1,4-benzoquinol methylase